MTTFLYIILGLHAAILAVGIVELVLMWHRRDR